MKDLTKRLVTGIILVLIITTYIYFGQYTFLLLIMGINLLGLLEFYRLFKSVAINPLKTLGLLQSTFLLLCIFFVLTKIYDWRIFLLNIPIAFLIFVSELYRRTKNPFQNLAFTFFGIFYITVPLAFLIALAFSPPEAGIYKPDFIFAYFFIVWASDTGAYFSGKLFGKHKLFSRISPKKTWEGSFGGAISALLISVAASRFDETLSIYHWLAIASIIILFGTYGDLIKSLMKRSLDVKDSGTVLPGHGGILDRFDSLLCSTPFVFCYLVLIMA